MAGRTRNPLTRFASWLRSLWPRTRRARGRRAPNYASRDRDGPAIDQERVIT